MWKQFTRRGNYKWVDTLKGLVDDYNDTVHSTIKMKPNQVTKEDETQLLEILNPNTINITKAKFKVGDQVRISTHKKFLIKVTCKTGPTKFLQSLKCARLGR